MDNGNEPAYPTLMNGHDCHGLTKRELFTLHAGGPAEDSDPKFVAACLGWPAPTMSNSEIREWAVWWMKAEAAWKVQQADYLLAELAKEQSK